MCDQRLANYICALRAMIQSDPDDAVAWQSLGIGLRRIGAYAEALSALETASLLTPLTVIARFALADCFVYAGKIELAGNLYEHIALVDDRAAANVRLAAGRSLAFLGNAVLAEQIAKLVLQDRPAYAEAYFDLSCYRAKRGADCAEIEHLARRAIHFAPGEPRYLASLSLLLHRHQRTNEAMDVAKQLSIESIMKLTCMCCLSRLASLFEAAGDLSRLAAATQTAQRLAEVSPSNC